VASVSSTVVAGLVVAYMFFRPHLSIIKPEIDTDIWAPVVEQVGGQITDRN
jgi:hypothetical protein